jgi:O-antigen/teichoic acid export membrane protein
MLHRVKSFLFKNTSTRQTVAKNTFWLAVSNFGGRLIRAIIIIYGARVLGAAGWGIFSYGVTLAAFLTPFTDIGLSQILIRETAKTSDPERRARVIATTLTIKLFLLLVGVAIVVLAAPYFTTIPEARALLPIIAFLLAFDTLREFGFALIRAAERMEWEAGLFLFTNVAIVGFGFLLLAVSPTPAAFTYGYTAGTAAGMFVTFWAVRRYIPRPLFPHVTRSLVRPIFSAAWPLSIAALLGLLMLHTDILIIGALRPAEDVGYYAAAYRIVQLLYLIPSILATSLFPTFSRLAGHDNTLMKTALERALTMVFLIALPLAAGGILIAPGLITFLFGAEFLPATAAFQILLLTLLVDFPVVILSNALFAYNRPKALTAYAAIGGLSNVALDFLLIPTFGITGSAWATLLAQVISNIYLWKVLRSINRFSVLRHLKPGILATLIMAAAVILLGALGEHVLTAVAVGGVTYALALYFLKEPILEEAKQVLATQHNS